MTKLIEQPFTASLSWTADYSTDVGTDTISASSWQASDPSITLTDGGHTTTTTTVKVTGGLPGQVYFITNIVTLATGQSFPVAFPYVCLATQLPNT